MTPASPPAKSGGRLGRYEPRAQCRPPRVAAAGGGASGSEDEERCPGRGSSGVLARLAQFSFSH
jgi:hypothetical protein